MKQDTIEYIIAMDKFKNYKPYEQIKNNIKKVQEEIDKMNNPDYLLEEWIRKAYRNRIGLYFRRCEEIMRRVIEDEKIRNVKSYR